jgi:hypothetical protein
MKIRVETQFDCTATGVTGHYRPARIPFVDHAGQTVDSEQSWNRSRNQQRNLETITQLIGLYTQLENLTEPEHNKDQLTWSFTFETQFAGVFASDNDELGLIKKQANATPMIVGLTESFINKTYLESDVNIWFTVLNAK